MSSISSIGSSILASLYSSNSSKSSKTGSSSSAIENLFAQLDTTGKGYLEKSDLSTAFSQISGTSSSTSTSSSSTASVDDVFAKLDSNRDGKVTEDELSTGLDALAAELDSQFNEMRMGGGTPPPPPSSDSGFSKDQLTQQLSDISSSSDSTRSDLLTKIVANFDSADSNSDGKVSFQEAQAYDQSSKATASSATGSTTSSDLAIMKRIMELMDAYALTSGTDSSSVANTLSVSA